MTAISAPASASGSSAGRMPGWPNESVRPGRVGPSRSAIARSAGLASTKAASHRRPQARAAGRRRHARHRLAEADRPARLPERIEGQARALGEQHHHRRAEHEAAHLLAALQRHLVGGIGPVADAPGARPIDRAVPDRGHAADDGGADEREHEPADRLRLEHADDALVAREQARHAARRGRVDREQRAGHVDHPAQHAVARHVDAVVVLRAEVERGEAAVVELLGERGVAADQRRGRVAVALGLEDLVLLDPAELADRAVDRADQVGVGERPRAFAQGAGEEVVEAGVGGDLRLGRLAHVDAVLAHEPAHQLGRRRAALARGDPAGEGGQAALGQQVLRQDLAAIGHGRRRARRRREFYRAPLAILGRWPAASTSTPPPPRSRGR